MFEMRFPSLRLPLFLLLFLAAGVNFSLSPQPALAESPQTFTDNGAWCWFQDPRAVYVEGEFKRTYAQWMTREGDLQIGSFDHESKQIQVHTIKKNWKNDDHNVGSFLVLPDKRLMVFYAQHNGHGLYCRTATSPEDITDWQPEVAVSETDRITYNHPVYLSDEKRFYVFWRGPSWKPTFSTSTDGKTWSEPTILVQEPEKSATTVRPYLKLVSDGKANIHVVYTDGHPRNEPHNSLYYLRYNRGKFYEADGSQVGSIDSLPILPSDSDLVYDGKANQVRAWVWDIALDSAGDPTIAYTRLPAETDHRYHLARWTGEQWHDQLLCKAGRWFPQTPEDEVELEPHYSGGMALNHADPSQLYLSRQEGERFVIEKWWSTDQDTSWQSQTVTGGDMANSGPLNVRPVVPRGYRGTGDLLLWMSGNYANYTDYKTGIKVLLPTK